MREVALVLSILEDAVQVPAPPKKTDLLCPSNARFVERHSKQVYHGILTMYLPEVVCRSVIRPL